MTVFAVLAHGYPETLGLLQRALAPAPVVVHLDARADKTTFVEEANATFIDERVSVAWGGFSIVEATIALYRAALEFVSDPQEYIVLLSGQCLPIAPRSALETFLSRSPGRQYARAATLLDSTAADRNRVLRSWYFDAHPTRRSGGRQQLHAVQRRVRQRLTPRLAEETFDGFTVVAGSQWTALTARCVQDLVTPSTANERLSALLAQAMAPDEIYFHTLLYSSQWAADALAQPLAPKAGRPTAAFSNLHFIDVSLSRQLDADDFVRLAATREHYFARKFDLATSPKLEELVTELR